MKFPRFEIHYADGAVIRGGGPEEEFVCLHFPKRWLEAPADGVVIINVESGHLGRRPLKESERYYCHAAEDPAGFTLGSTDPECGIGPYLRTLGVVKEGKWVEDDRYQEILRKATESQWVPQISAVDPRGKRKVRDG